MNFSLEVTTRTNLSELPKLNDIYVTFLPGTSYKDVIEQTKALSKSGFNAIPHFPARSITDLDMLKDYVDQIKEATLYLVLALGVGAVASATANLFIQGEVIAIDPSLQPTDRDYFINHDNQNNITDIKQLIKKNGSLYSKSISHTHQDAIKNEHLQNCYGVIIESHKSIFSRTQN